MNVNDIALMRMAILEVIDRREWALWDWREDKANAARVDFCNAIQEWCVEREINACSHCGRPIPHSITECMKEAA